MEAHEIKHLLQKYYDGDSSLAEEHLLNDHFAKKKGTIDSEDWQFFEAMNQLKAEKNKDFSFPDRLMLKIHEEEYQQKFDDRPGFRSYWLVAASIALLLVGFGGGVFYEKESMPRTEMTALQKELSDMKKMLMHNQLNQVSASERIMAVHELKLADEPDMQILESLIYTMNADPNPNVRLAAVEALAHYHQDKTAQQALKASLTEQRNPNVQIAILDVLASSGQKDAVHEIQQFLQQDDLQEEVKKQAESSLNTLL